VDPSAGALASTHVGGATRILIIDAEGNPAQPVPPNSEGGHEQIHEFQVATPVPSDGSQDASVVRELIARVEELLRQTRGLPAGATTGLAGTVRFGSVLLEPSTQTVLRGGQPVRVTHTEFRLLLALMRRRGAIASRVELLREVWGAGAAVSRRAVDTHIARLRRKLEEDPARPRHIVTALALGYRFRP
jgi:transcriptional regulator